jgi:hypothetical protein
MVDEQELSRASNDANDAPSLQVARSSGRPWAPTKRLLESQGQEQSIKPPRRKLKLQFNVYEELNTPLPT